MNRALWRLPEGVEELLPPCAWQLELLRRRLLDLYYRWGYELIVTPFIEYLDALLTGVGTDLALQTFTLTDQLSGRLLGVRADITPQAARIDAHRLQRDVPVRLCYLGTVLRTRPDGLGGTRSPMQVGAELYGHAGTASDIEILTLMLATLAETGLSGVHVDLGHVAIYRTLAQAAGLDDEAESVLFDALQRKARPEIAALLARLVDPAQHRRWLAALPELNGGAEVLEAAEHVLAGAPPAVTRALAELRAVIDGLSRSMPETVWHIDLAELRGYHYHTGLVFAAFVPGSGRAVALGGRYDHIGEIFGRARPATGFSTDLRQLVALIERQVPLGIAIYAPPVPDDPSLAARVAELRRCGERVIQGLPGQNGTGRQLGCDRELRRDSGSWVVVPLVD